MNNLYKILLGVLILSVSIEIRPAPFDTGMIELQQPDETTFTGRIWGDEFFWWAETEDGYRFVQSGDGWYYYVQLNQDGEFAPTIYKVGIDNPPASSYQLERTQSRIDEIQQRIGEFNEKIKLNRQWFAIKQAEAQSQPVTLKVGIILIEFTDVTRYKNSQINRPNGYLMADFDSMMFSYNYWIGAGINSPHPEEEEVFGSFRDYWHQMSLGNLKIEGKVVNPDTTGDGVPEWIMADSTRSYYANPSTNIRTLALEAIDEALNLGYISENQNDSNYYDKYAIIYAQYAIPTGALMVHAEGIGEEFKYHLIAERSGPKLFGGTIPEKSFTQIGYCGHEFGHTMGFDDEYEFRDYELSEDGSTELFNFDIMAWGCGNGPLYKGECPATLSPYQRINKTWVRPDTLTNDEYNFVVEYNYLNPKFYCIVPVNATEDEHYIFETKKREGFDLYIPSNPADSVNQAGRLIIWQHKTHSEYPTPNYTDRIRIKPADNIRNKQTQLSDFFPADFSLNNFHKTNHMRG